jgi:UDP-galactopyranose mutase
MIVCFSNIDWGVLRYRKQHLMERLARRTDVVYVNPPRAVKAHRLLERHRVRAVTPRLRVYEPPVLPGIRHSALVKRATYRLIARRVRHLAGREPAVLWLYSPDALAFADLIPAGLVVYDIADAYATPGGPHVRSDAERREIALLERLERALLRRADVVLCVSEPLAARARALNANVRVVPNGSDWDRYASLEPGSAQPGAPPLIGFVGTIAPRLDVDLVAGIARARPEWRIDLVGPVSPLVDLRPLRDLPNVELPGEIPYEEVPARISRFDVCLLPLHQIDFAHCCSPIQVYDYLAAGKPVVSSPVAQVERWPDLVRTARGVAEFVAGIESALATRDAGAAAARRAFAKAHSWDVRVDHVRAILREAAPSLDAAASPHPDRVRVA